MKHFIKKPDLNAIFYSKNEEERREERFLAFEAEFDINRPFEIEWSTDDKYFVYRDGIYFYRPQYESEEKNKIELNELQELLDPQHNTAVYVGQSPHFYEFELRNE